MPSYPSFAQLRASEEQTLDDIVIDRAVNGTPKSRAFYTARKKIFRIRHKCLLAADKATLNTFYETNRLLNFDFTWNADSVLYSCRFAGPIKYTLAAGGRWEADVNMVQV